VFREIRSDHTPISAPASVRDSGFVGPVLFWSEADRQKNTVRRRPLESGNMLKCEVYVGCSQAIGIPYGKWAFS